MLCSILHFSWPSFVPHPSFLCKMMTANIKEIIMVHPWTTRSDGRVYILSYHTIVYWELLTNFPWTACCRSQRDQPGCHSGAPERPEASDGQDQGLAGLCSQGTHHSYSLISLSFLRLSLNLPCRHWLPRPSRWWMRHRSVLPCIETTTPPCVALLLTVDCSGAQSTPVTFVHIYTKLVCLLGIICGDCWCTSKFLCFFPHFFWRHCLYCISPYNFWC